MRYFLNNWFRGAELGSASLMFSTMLEDPGRKGKPGLDV